MRSGQFKPKELTLKTGKTVLIRMVDLSRLVIKNSGSPDIPDYVRSRVIAELNGEKVSNEPPEINKQNMDDNMRFLMLVCRSALISPRVVEEPDYEKDQISMDDLSTLEIIEIAVAVMPKAEDVQAVKSFRSEPSAHVESVPDVQGVSDAATPISATETSLASV